MMSSSAVYNDIHVNTSEDNFLAKRYSLKWCERPDYDYSEAKRQAKCAVVQHFPEQKYIASRTMMLLTNRLPFLKTKIRMRFKL